MVSDGVDEGMGVIFVEVFDAKVIKTEGGWGFVCLVVPDAWCVLHGFIPIEGDFIHELFECDDAGFFEAVHSAADFEAEVPISFNVEVVFVYNLL